MAKKEIQKKESHSSAVAQKFKQNPALYIGSVFILVLVTVTFVLGDALSGGMGRGPGDLTFGVYDKIPINWVPGNMFAEYYERAYRYYQSQGIPLDDFQVQAQIWRQSYEMAVIHTAVLQIMNKSNYVIPEKTVNRNVAQLPQFQENGVFSRTLYNQMSDSRKNALWRQIQEELTKMKYFDALFGIMIPEAEAAFIANMASKMRRFDMVSFDVEDYPASEFAKYAQENPELFSSINLSIITVNNEREARRILETINSGTILFEDAARSQSQDGYADRGGDMGNQFFYELDTEIPNVTDRQLIFSLGKGELSGVVPTSDGWAIFRIEEDAVPVNMNNEVTAERVRSYVRNYQRGLMEDWAIIQADVFIEEVNRAGFDTAVRRRNLQRQSFGPVPINHGSLDLFTTLDSFNVPDLGNIANNENFWQVAFSTELRTPSQPFVQGSNVFVFYPTQEIEAEASVTENIASLYSAYWLNNTIEQSLSSYFLKHPKMEDNFWEVFFRDIM
ncbi:MAG: peptidylprolyl isomerase [Treponema sp.]|nr:peptidylprolyl isomerase [Treponema sp.]